MASATSEPVSVFISYAHAQTDVVDDIMAGLLKRGHHVWFDKTGIDHGDDWRRKITDGLMTSNSVLSFLSREAIRENGVCLDELGIAVGVKYGNIRTILLQQESELQPIPSQLTHRQWLDMSDWRQKKSEGPETYRQWLQEKLAIIIRMIENPESREFVGEINTIRSKLGIDDSALSRQSWYLRQPFVGRKWLAEKLDAWLDNPQGGHLCAVYGGPGTGKSAFAAQYVYRSPRVAASLFFEHGNSYFNTPDAIVRELVFQLACRLPSYRRLLLYTLNSMSDKKTLNTQELFETLLACPLQHAGYGEHDTLCVVIDGLDECEHESQRLAAQLLSAERFPQWLRVVVVTRPENSVIANLKPDLELHMTEDAAANNADIRTYFARRLEKRLTDHADREQILDSLTENAQGVFLYAYIVADMILHNKLDLTDHAAYPRGLNASFEKWFSRYFPDIDEYNRLYKLPLGLIAACSEPIPVGELERINGWYDRRDRCFHLAAQDDHTRRETIVKQLERCALLLKYGQNKFGETTVAFSHRYIVEWLTGMDTTAGQSASQNYFCAPADAFWALSRTWCEHMEQGQPVTVYQALHLLDAMRAAGETEDTIRKAAGHPAWQQLLAEKDTQYDRAGKYQLCLAFTQTNLERSRCAYGDEDHPGTLMAMNNLANTYSDLGRYQEALSLQEKVYDFRRRIQGEEHPDTLIAMNNLAVTYSDLGRYQAALDLATGAYDGFMRILGSDHPYTRTALRQVMFCESAITAASLRGTSSSLP